MAQVQKEDIRRIILQAARGEFLQKGFKDTSMRTIARLSGVTLSNIYNYFRDKDEIFRAVLTPLLNAFEQLFAEHNSDDYMSKEFFSMDSHQKKLIDDFMVIPTNYGRSLRYCFSILRVRRSKISETPLSIGTRRRACGI